jgi:tetratricopeptide (TPR) repeat protein
LPLIFAQSKQVSELSVVQQIEKKTAQSELKKFRKSVDQARKLHEAKDYQNAIIDFEAALLIIPNHPQILSELAFTALFAQEYEIAIQASEKALSTFKIDQPLIEKDTDLLGSICFNLGSAYEKQGDVSKASQAYVKSLEYRLNRIVRERLEAIDPQKYAQFDTFHTKTLKGPLISQDQLCQAIIKNSKDPVEKKNPCQFIILDKQTTIDQAGLLDALRIEKNIAQFKNDPNLSLGIISFEISDLPMSIDFRFFMKSSKGYFYQEQPISIYNPGAFGIHQHLSIQKIKRFKFFGYGNPVFKIQFQTDFTDMDMAGTIENHQSSTYLMWCGLGQSLRPSCTKPLEISHLSETSINQLGEEKVDLSAEKPLEKWSLSVEDTDQTISVKQGELILIKKLPKSASFEIGERKLIIE